MHARPVRRRGLNRASEKLLVRGVLLMLEGSDGPRNRRSLLEGPLLQDNRVGSEGNEAQRRAHELKHDACSYRPARSKMAFRWGRNGSPLSPWVLARVAAGSMVTEHPPRKRPS